MSCSGSMSCARNCAQKWDGQSQLPLYDWVGIADIAASQIDDVRLSRSCCKQPEEQEESFHAVSLPLTAAVVAPAADAGDPVLQLPSGFWQPKPSARPLARASLERGCVCVLPLPSLPSLSRCRCGPQCLGIWSCSPFDR